MAPGTKAQLGPLARVIALTAARATGGEPQRVFLTIGRHRRLFRWWVAFAGTLLFRSHLPRRDIELLVLRSAFNCSSPYEWAQHVPLARAAGLDLKDVRAVADPGSASVLSTRQRLLIEAADELHTERVIGDATWGRLESALDDLELIELCMVVGQYEMLAMTLNSLGVRPEPSALRLLDHASRATVEELDARIRGRPSGPSRGPGHPDSHTVGEPPAAISST